MTDTPKPKRRPRKRAKDRQRSEGHDVVRRPRASQKRVLNEQRKMALGATITIIGLGFVGISQSFVGMLFVIVGLLTLLWSIHKFGRLGAE